MNIHKISNNKELLAFQNLYLKSFPEEERLDFELLKSKADEGRGNFLGLFDQQNLVGMIYYSEYQGTIYIFYFAIDQQLQSHGYGKIMLDYMFETFQQHKIILLVEEINSKAENNEQRIRRKKFYLKNGFTSNQQFLQTLGLNFELIHREGNTAYVADYQKIREYFYSAAKND